MKSISPTISFNEIWELAAEPGDHRPTQIKLYHNEKWFTYQIVSLEGSKTLDHEHYFLPNGKGEIQCIAYLYTKGNNG